MKTFLSCDKVLAASCNILCTTFLHTIEKACWRFWQSLVTPHSVGYTTHSYLIYMARSQGILFYSEVGQKLTVVFVLITVSENILRQYSLK